MHYNLPPIRLPGTLKMSGKCLGAVWLQNNHISAVHQALSRPPSPQSSTGLCSLYFPSNPWTQQVVNVGVRPYFVIYDDACPVCTSGIERLKLLDRLGIIEPVPGSSPKMPDGVTPPSPDRLEREMVLIDPDGTVLGGSDAVARLLSVLPRTALLGRFLQLPFVRTLARPIYRWIARRRYRLTGGTGGNSQEASSRDKT